jgi:hypothetical protein
MTTCNKSEGEPRKLRFSRGARFIVLESWTAFGSLALISLTNYGLFPDRCYVTAAPPVTTPLERRQPRSCLFQTLKGTLAIRSRGWVTLAPDGAWNTAIESHRAASCDDAYAR